MAARHGKEMMPRREGAGGGWEGKGSREVESPAAESLRGGEEQRRAVGDGDPEVLHRHRRRAKGGRSGGPGSGQWF